MNEYGGFMDVIPRVRVTETITSNIIHFDEDIVRVAREPIRGFTTDLIISDDMVKEFGFKDLKLGDEVECNNMNQIIVDINGVDVYTLLLNPKDDDYVLTYYDIKHDNEYQIMNLKVGDCIGLICNTDDFKLINILKDLE